jgi:SNF2 family DNA or RNA helicase
LLPHLAARFATDIAYLHGGTPKARRDEMVERFQSGHGAPIFLLSLKAGGTGLNLTAANHVIHLDRWWNPAVENQATDRAFRIGQRRNVQVRKFLCPGTVEERIEAMIAQKTALSGLVVGEGENWLTELSTDSLRSLFLLDEEAAVDDS